MKQQRLTDANELIGVIASCGRDFFAHANGVSRLELDARGRVWFVDAHSGKRVYTHARYSRWRGFTNGGTLRALIERLRDYVTKGKLLPPSIFGPWPEWVCGGDLWGYGEDMQKVRDAAARLGMMKSSN